MALLMHTEGWTTRWTRTRVVIAGLGPPLNQAHNRAHPLHPVIAAARAAYRRSAGTRPPATG